MLHSGGVNAAADLVGHVLPGGWRVIEKIERRPGDTGGRFSINYWVENDTDGRRGFCKVLDTEWILNATRHGHNQVDVMALAARTYQFERDLARECVRLSKVITALDDGTVVIPGYVLDTVSYIIFESADRDIRKLLDASDQLDIPLRLRSLQNLATGLKQLHGQHVAHQDVKPSNTLVFEADNSGNRVTKVGDLGRATVQGRPIDHDELPIAGDPAYAPPEGLYGAVPDGMGPRRFGCDLYQLGSMLCYVFTALPFNALLADQLYPAHNWENWGGAYEDVLPFVRDAFGRALEVMADDIPKPIRQQVVSLVEQLCEPNPMLRGHRKTRSQRGNPYALDRIVTELDLLASRSRIELRAK